MVQNAPSYGHNIFIERGGGGYHEFAHLWVGQLMFCSSSLLLTLKSFATETTSMITHTQPSVHKLPKGKIEDTAVAAHFAIRLMSQVMIPMMGTAIKSKSVTPCKYILPATFKDKILPGETHHLLLHPGQTMPPPGQTPRNRIINRAKIFAIMAITLPSPPTGKRSWKPCTSDAMVLLFTDHGWSFTPEFFLFFPTFHFLHYRVFDGIHIQFSAIFRKCWTPPGITIHKMMYTIKRSWADIKNGSHQKSQKPPQCPQREMPESSAGTKPGVSRHWCRNNFQPLHTGDDLIIGIAGIIFYGARQFPCCTAGHTTHIMIC